jgi:LPXTG-motif cell wall-anchored protein
VRERPYSLGLCIKTSDDVIPREPPKAFDFEKARSDAVKKLTPTMQRWPVFMSQSQLAMKPSKDIADCNSNTHFAALAVWAARKHGVPVEHSLALLAQRFRTSQAADGSWGYNYGNGGSQSMTCVALLGLAIGHVVAPEAGVPPEKDPKVVNGFAWLSKKIGAPKGVIDNQQPVKSLASGLYYMWAMERIAVIYDVAKLDKKDWYQWGAEILLCHQKPDGSWEDGGYHGENPILNTSFALLFLKRANLTPDLSRRFTIDTTALTNKVSETVAPPKVPLDPPREPDPPKMDPEPEPPMVTAKEPPPTPKPPTPTPQPQPQATAEQPSSPPPKESSGMIWVILGVVVLLGLVGLLFFLKKKNGEDEDEKPKKKKKKKAKAKTEEKEKAKAKSKAEDEDDDE